MRKRNYVRELPPALNVIFIGDSYGAGMGLSNTSNNWINKAVAWLGRAPGFRSFKYKKSAVSGSGFIGNGQVSTFLDQITSITTVGDEFNLDVTDIVVLGGWNDNNKEITALNTAFYNFQQFCIQNYPYARIHVGYVSWACAEMIGNTTKVELAVGLENYIKCARENCMTYIGNIQYIMHDYSLFQSDGLHPNDLGNYRIASAVVTHLLGGDVEAIDSYRNFNPTWNSNISDHGTSTSYFTYRHNGRSGIYIGSTSWTFTSGVNFASHPADDNNGVGWYKIFELPRGQLFEGSYVWNGATKVALPAAYWNGSTWTTAMTWVWFRIEDGHTGMYISPYVVGGYATESAAAYKPLTGITQVMFNVANLNFDFDSLYC